MEMTRAPGLVVAVSRAPSHGFAKQPQAFITLLEGLGVEGDAHAGRTAQHLYRKTLDPTAPNLAQVHFLHAELFEEVAADGYALAPGQMGENVLTRGIDLISLPTGTLFQIGAALVEISGIRDPCKKIEVAGKGLTKRLFDRDAAGRLVRKAGIMGIVRRGGLIVAGEPIDITLPSPPFRRLEVV
jgi:MOSC domain-containing protein YiiM